MNRNLMDQAHAFAVRRSVLCGAVTGASTFALCYWQRRRLPTAFPSVEWIEGHDVVVPEVGGGPQPGSRGFEVSVLPNMRLSVRSLGGFDSSMTSHAGTTSQATRFAGGTALAGLWGALCTWPCAAAEWRYALFGSRGAWLVSQPAAAGLVTGVRLLWFSWFTGACLSGTIMTGGVLVVGIPAAMVATMPALASGVVIFPIWHRQIALNLVRKCLV